MPGPGAATSIDLPAASPDALPLLTDDEWQMTFGERLALEGLLARLRPALALETGTARGGSLRRIAAYSAEVHAFDLLDDLEAVVAELPNARAHVGDSAVTLPAVLDSFAAGGRTVDFALIDGDHSAAGVQRDVRAVIDSPACTNTVVVLHDTANEQVRGALEALDLPSHPKVALCLLDAVPGFMVGAWHERAGQIWNGMGMLLLDAERGADGPAETEGVYVNVSEAYRGYRDGR